MGGEGGKLGSRGSVILLSNAFLCGGIEWYGVPHGGLVIQDDCRR